MDDQTTKEALAAISAAPTEGEPYFKLTLEKPFMAYGDKVTTFSFRRPTTTDILQIGLPILVNVLVDPPQVNFVEPKMVAMIERLSQMPGPSIQKMDSRDWVTCMYRVAAAMMPNRDIISSITSEQRCTLTKAVTDPDGEQITELRFRAPTGLDLMSQGMPMTIIDGVPNFFEIKAAKLIAALTGKSLEIIAALEADDFVSCLWGLVPFFLPRTMPG